jgi:serine/threonine protein kinase
MCKGDLSLPNIGNDVMEESQLANSTLSHYRIVSKIGAGGMGDVYLAEDTKLDRKIALKILPSEVASDRDRLDRFIREAKAAAALNHPNIAHVYEIGESDGVRFIAMEYVDGQTLRELLQRGRLTLTRSIELTAQVAAGLAEAHQSGFIHRDIKPENLMLPSDSSIKILDFGLAKLIHKQRNPAELSELSTVANRGDAAHLGTSAGTILGTVSYMSPEQATGEKVDQRTDIFSLGIVFYEMLSGRRPFDGNSAIDTMHAIINREPTPVAEFNPRLPLEISDILEKALAKNPTDRYRDASDFELDLRRFKRALESNSLISMRIPGTVDTGKRSSISKIWIGIGALLLLGIILTAWRFFPWRASNKNSMDLASIALTPLTTDPGYEGEPTFSADGQRLAYVSDRTGNFEIFLKQISGGPDINLTNNLADDVQPAFSPDGKQIAFVSTRASSSNLLYPGVDYSLLGGDIWVMPALGGSARRIAESGNFPSWSPDGTAIIYTNGTTWFRQKMFRVSAQGGEPQEIPITFKSDEPPAPFWLHPSYSPDAHWIAFDAGGKVFIVSAAGGEARPIVRGLHPVWTSDGRIIYSNGTLGKSFSLWQVPLSTTEGIASGPAQPITVGRGRDMQAAISPDNKVIAFAAQGLSFNVEVLPFDAETGHETGEVKSVTQGANVIYFCSGNGDSIVFESYVGSGSHIWRVDPNSVPIQLTSDQNFTDTVPRWSPEGKTIAFIRRPANTPESVATGRSSSLWLMSPDGANPRRLIENAANPVWMPSGKAIAYGSVVNGNQNQLNIYDLTIGTARQITNEPGVVPICTFSPDGKWLIYQSNPNGNIDLRAIPADGGESRIVVGTLHQDYHPSVSPSGNWLYVQLDHKNIYRVPGPAQNWRQAEPQKVTNFPESGLFLEDPQVSRDGRQLIYSHGRISGDLWLINLGG